MNFFLPMTPATTGPELMPMRNASLRSPNVRVATASAHIDRKLYESGRVVRSLARHSRRDHVAVADGLDLLEIVLFHQVVEALEDVVEQIDQTQRSHSSGHRRELDDISEENAGGTRSAQRWRSGRF